MITKTTHGGPGRGQGRKPLEAGEDTVSYTLKMPASLRDKARELGAERVRALIEAAAAGDDGDDKARDTLPASLAGRCASDREADQGTRVHAVPYSQALATNGYAINRAICGAKPGPRSAGWSYFGPRAVTCPKCLARMHSAN